MPLVVDQELIQTMPTSLSTPVKNKEKPKPKVTFDQPPKVRPTKHLFSTET